MPPKYTCEKCAAVFKLKKEYTAHSKTDCLTVDIVDTLDMTGLTIASPKSDATPKGSISRTSIITVENLSIFFENLHNLLWNKAGLSPERALENMTFFFAYRLIEPQIDILELPIECKWSYIASLPSDDDIFESIKKGVNAFRRNEKTKPFFKPHDIVKASLVSDIVMQINRIPVETLEGTDVLGDIFEYMLGRGMSTMSDEGQYFTNRMICRLAFKLAYDIKKTLRRDDGTLCTFADWFCGTGGFPAEYVRGVKTILPDVDWSIDSESIYCQDMNISSVTTTLLNMLILTSVPFNNKKIRSANSFADSIITGHDAPYKGLSIDYCFMNPPYGGDKTKGKDYRFAYTRVIKNVDGSKMKIYEVNKDIQSIGIEDDDKVSSGVQLAMATLANNGVCCIVLPQGFFFGANKKITELRKRLIEEYKIHYVVDFESGTFVNTGTKTSMLVFQKGVGPTKSIKFIDMDETLLIETSIDDLRLKNYSLQYKRYIPQVYEDLGGFEMIKLGDLIYKKSSGKTKVCDITNTGEYKFYSCKINNPCGSHSLFDHDESEYLLFAKSGGNSSQPINENLGIGQVYYITEKTASTSDVIKFIVKDKLNTYLKYIYYVLKSKIFEIQALARYTTGLGHIDIDYMLDTITIPLPSIKRQQRIVGAIDGFTSIIQKEEEAIKVYEQSIMTMIESMCTEDTPNVRLGDVCILNHGKRITKHDDIGILYPVYGGGGDTFKTNFANRDGLTCKISRFGISEHNCVQILYGKYWLMDSGFTIESNNAQITNCYVYYWLLKHKLTVFGCGRSTGQMNLDLDIFMDLNIPLPPIEEQIKLNIFFDEIRHKYEIIPKLKEIKEQAIKDLIPCAL